jgi:hypothetical protein
MGIEVPESVEWQWPEGPLADFGCLPRDPEVHVGVRVAEISSEDFGGERYRVGARTFEVAREDGGWLLGLMRRGKRELLASFDLAFRAGEVVLSSEAARRPGVPLRSPLDEWIVVHRTFARGGLCLDASLEATGKGARIRLGSSRGAAGMDGSEATPSMGLFGGHGVIVREQAQQLRAYGTPWGESGERGWGSAALGLCEIVIVEESIQPFRERLDPVEAAELLVAHAVAPLCDDGLLDRVLRNARALGERAAIYRIGEPSAAAPALEWRSAQLCNAFAPPSQWL